MTARRRSLLELLRDLRDRDFACKVRERIRRDRNPLLVTVQDKYALREYARARGVRMARLLHAAEDVEGIPFEGLPPDCFLKASNACARNILRHRSQFYDFGCGADLLDADGTIDEARAAVHRPERRYHGP
jgi:hypothetical protein